MDRRKGIGAWGETQAAKYLKKKGFRIVERNWSCRFGEIDLIAADREYLAFVEVKLRKSDAFARAAEFVDRHKQNRLRMSAELWLSLHETELQPRFDVVEIYAPEGEATKKPIINHLEDAFQ